MIVFLFQGSPEVDSHGAIDTSLLRIALALQMQPDRGYREYFKPGAKVIDVHKYLQQIEQDSGALRSAEDWASLGDDSDQNPNVSCQQ